MNYLFLLTKGTFAILFCFIIKSGIDQYIDEHSDNIFGFAIYIVGGFACSVILFSKIFGLSVISLLIAFIYFVFIGYLYETKIEDFLISLTADKSFTIDHD